MHSVCPGVLALTRPLQERGLTVYLPETWDSSWVCRPIQGTGHHQASELCTGSTPSLHPIC